MAAPEEKAATGHPLLQVLKRDRYTHGLRPVQMEALRAMCGALIPSLQPEEEEALDGRVDQPRRRSKDLERFYLASGADSTVPDEVAELAFTRCVWEGGVLVNVTLWLLCTRLGTLALCGLLCISGEFPYVRRFADMPVEQREETLKRWTRARWLIPVKIAFAIVKSLCLSAFYTTAWPSIRWWLSVLLAGLLSLLLSAFFFRAVGPSIRWCLPVVLAALLALLSALFFP